MAEGTLRKTDSLPLAVGKSGFQAPYRDGDEQYYASSFRNWRRVDDCVQVWSYTATQFATFERDYPAAVIADRSVVVGTFAQWGEPIDSEYKDGFLKIFLRPANPLIMRLLSLIKPVGDFEGARKRPYWRVHRNAAMDLWHALVTTSGVDLRTAYLAFMAAIKDHRAEARQAKRSLSVALGVPDGLALYSHQEVGVRFLMGRSACLMADDQGMGKTIQVIIGAMNLKLEGPDILILSPASVVFNWQKEIEKWSGEKATVLGSFDKPLDGWNIVSVDTAKRDGPLRKALLKKSWDVMVIDEAHMVKKTTTQRWKFANKVSRARTWLLTGTPIMSRPMDLYGLLKLTGHTLGRNKHKFGVLFCGAKTNAWSGGYDYLGATNLDQLAKDLDSWMIRRTKDECLDLPPKTRVEQDVKIGRKIPIGYDKEALMTARSNLSRAKAPQTLIHVLECLENGNKALVFCEFLDAIKIIEDGLQKAGYKTVTITGATSKAARERNVNAFQRGDADVFVGQTLAAGVGITLTAARYVYFNDLSLVPSYHAQAEDRAYRIGQTGSVWCYYMLADHKLDKVLWEMLKSKIDTISNFEAGISPAITPFQLLKKVQQY